MTDRERLLEQVREAEQRAVKDWRFINQYQPRHSDEEIADAAAGYARESAHHALTALALRELIEYRDKVENTGFIYREPFLSTETIAQMRREF